MKSAMPDCLFVSSSKIDSIDRSRICRRCFVYSRQPNSSATSRQRAWMFFMMVQSRSSTSWRVQENPMEFWDISSPLTATPPALAALAGAKATPARRKSLAGPQTEFSHVSSTLTHYALVRPDVRFRLVHDGEELEPDGVEVVVHVVEHFSYHTGQISLLTKLSTGADLGVAACTSTWADHVL